MTYSIRVKKNNQEFEVQAENLTALRALANTASKKFFFGLHDENEEL